MERTCETCSLWIHWEKRIISFHPEEGFEEVHCDTRAGMMAFVVEQGNRGFAIQ